MGKIKKIFLANWDIIIILFLAFLSLSPYIIQNGYFLGIDFIFGPKIQLIDGQYYPNYILWITIQKILSFIIPTTIIQKGLFLGFFIVGIFSIRKFLSIFFENKLIIFIGMLFFLFNPFVYPRLVQGHIYILYAYSLIPLLYYFLYNKKYILYGFIGSIIISLSPHFIFFIFLISIIYFIINYKQKYNYKELLIGFFILILINLYWIPNILTGTNISNFNVNDLYAFQSGNIYFQNIYFEILSLNGFWGDNENRYLLEKNNFKYVFLYFLLFISFIGFFSGLKGENKKHNIFFITILIISFILSIGISQNNIFSNFNKFLFENIPYYIGLRESNKWSGLMVLGYIYLFLNGLKFLFSKFNSNKNIIFGLVIIIIIFNNATMTFIFGGNIKSYKYPNDWYDIKKVLNINGENLNCDYKIKLITTNCYSYLSLPWHQSIGLSFTKKIVMNPSGLFFGKNTLVGDNIEIRNIYSQSNRPESKIIEKYIGPNGLFRKKEIKDEDFKKFIVDLKGLGIVYIILLHEADYKYYEQFLEKLKSKNFIKIEKQNKMITLYKIIN